MKRNLLDLALNILTVPRNLCSLFTILPKDNPGVILRQSQVNVIQPKYLTSSYYSKSNSKTVQLVSYKQYEF